MADLEKLEAEAEAAKARYEKKKIALRDAKARDKAQERKDDTRRKILLGTVLDQTLQTFTFGQDPEGKTVTYEAWKGAILDSHFRPKNYPKRKIETINKDRNLFGLPSIPDS